MSLFEIHTGLNDEYRPMINDIIKFTTFLVIAEIARNYVMKLPLISIQYIVLTVIFTIVGLATYYLVINKLVKFT
jgi:hypothetical protein